MSSQSILKLINWIDKQPGYRVVRQRQSSHFRVYGPPSTSAVTISATPGKKCRAWKNITADLKRIGLTDVPKF